jgi:pimeloyl-ACP methyl ester carboxylesterase
MEPIMKKLANHLKCVAPCMRGFGYSSYNKDMSSFKDLAADLKLFINEHMKFEKFYIIGHQLGGCVGLELAHLM